MRVIHPCYYLLSQSLIGQSICFFKKPDSGFDSLYIRLPLLLRAVQEPARPHILSRTLAS
jgi:hypothetical protein